MLSCIGYAMLMSSVKAETAAIVSALPSCAHVYGNDHTTGVVLVDVHQCFRSLALAKAQFDSIRHW